MEDLDEKIAPLLRMIAHDLKGLLGTPGLLIHLAESASDEELATHLAALRESFKALDRAVTDVGDVGYAVGKAAAPAAQRTDVRELLEGTLQLARGAGVQRRIELVGELAPGPWPAVSGDPQTLGRTLERLVYWGIAHAPSGSRVVIDAGVDGGAIRVRVPAGNGAAHVVPTVRERLAELESGNKELGIALPLAREALERCGGSLAFADGVLEARIPAGA